MPQANASEIELFLRMLEQVAPDSEVFAHSSRILDSHLLQPVSDALEASPPGPARFLTIAMATYDDYDATFFTVQSLRMYHPEIADETAILVVDNHPSGPRAPALKRLTERVPGCRYVPYDRFTGTAVKDLLFREANSEFVLVMDAHVLFVPGALAKLVAFLKTQRHSSDLFQGPVIGDDLNLIATHYDHCWSQGTYGKWGLDERAADPDAPPFEISMQGAGVFACRKEAWPGLNPRFQGFCVEEGYLHEKIRRKGGKVVCLPFLRWLHRFREEARPPYPMNWEDRIRNHLIAYDELGLDDRPVREHFESHLGAENVRPCIDATLREIAGPYHAFDACFAINGDAAGYQRAIGTPVRRVVAPATPWNPEIGRFLALRSIFAEAVKQDLHSILILEDNPVRGSAYDSADIECALAQLPDTPTKIAMWLRKQGTIENSAAP